MKCPSCNYLAKGSICDICDSVIFHVEVKKKKPIPKRSKKMATEMIEYNKLRKQFLLENPYCKVYPGMRSTQIHHMAGRIGSMLLDTSHWIAVSAKGHQKIETEPGWAILNGFSELRLKNYDL